MRHSALLAILAIATFGCRAENGSSGENCPNGNCYEDTTTSVDVCEDGIDSVGPDGSCTPACAGKKCGDDGCGGSCGSCTGDSLCDNVGRCVPVYQDGCNNNDGNCPSGYVCNDDGNCVGGCVPKCAGKQCGADGCDGYCGNCPSGSSCQNGACVYIVIDEVCNDGVDNDKDGATDCSDPDCDGTVACDTPVCTPSCSGKTCGPNGCGGSCGTCGAGSWCDNGTCEGVYELSCTFTGYMVNMKYPDVRINCPATWSFGSSALDAYGHIAMFVRNNGSTDGDVISSTKIEMADTYWSLSSDPPPSEFFAIVDGQPVGFCGGYPLETDIIVKPGKGQAFTANCP